MAQSALSDPRIALFDPDTTGLEDVDPLYAQDTFILFDQYADGDPYGDPAYIACFQTALKAIRKKRKLRIRFPWPYRRPPFDRVYTLPPGIFRQGR